MISPQTYSDIFNDAVKDSVKRATDIAALYNSGPAEKSAYREFRAEWDKAVNTHRAGIQTLFQDASITDLYKKLDRLLDGKRVNVDTVTTTLQQMADKVAAETTAVGHFDVERLRMLQRMSSIAMAEGGMKRYPAIAKQQTRQTTDKLLDRDMLDRLERAAENHRDIYLDIAQRAMEKITAQQERDAKREMDIARNLPTRPATTKSLSAPPTARFRRKPPVQP